MTSSCSGYPPDVSADEWALIAPYLTLLREDAGQCEPSLRAVFNGRRYVVKTGAPWRWMPNDLPPWEAVDQPGLRSTPESGERAGYDGGKRKKGSKVHLAVDTLGHLPALHVTPADADDRAQVGRLAEAVQAATGGSVDLAYVDQGYTGEKPAKAARQHGIEPEVVKLPEAKRGFVLLPRHGLGL